MQTQNGDRQEFINVFFYIIMFKCFCSMCSGICADSARISWRWWQGAPKHCWTLFGQHKCSSKKNVNRT